jgi:hypothetical protein
MRIPAIVTAAPIVTGRIVGARVPIPPAIGAVITVPRIAMVIMGVMPRRIIAVAASMSVMPRAAPNRMPAAMPAAVSPAAVASAVTRPSAAYAAKRQRQSSCQHISCETHNPSCPYPLIDAKHASFKAKAIISEETAEAAE